VPVADDVVGGNDLQGVVAGEAVSVENPPGSGGLISANSLCLADSILGFPPSCAVNHLRCRLPGVDHNEIDDAEPPDAGPRQNTAQR